MRVVRLEDGRVTDPTKPRPGHFGHSSISLHNKDTGTQGISAFVIHILPGGIVERGIVTHEAVLYVLSGCMTLTVFSKKGQVVATLNPNDSVYEPAGEEREIRNNGVVPLTYVGFRATAG